MPTSAYVKSRISRSCNCKAMLQEVLERAGSEGFRFATYAAPLAATDGQLRGRVGSSSAVLVYDSPATTGGALGDTSLPGRGAQPSPGTGVCQTTSSGRSVSPVRRAHFIRPVTNCRGVAMHSGRSCA